MKNRLFHQETSHFGGGKKNSTGIYAVEGGGYSGLNYFVSTVLRFFRFEMMVIMNLYRQLLPSGQFCLILPIV